MENRNKIFEKRSEKGKKISKKDLLKAEVMLANINKKKFEIKQSYEIGKQFYNKEISRDEGLSNFYRIGIKHKFAIDYLPLFSNLIQGKLYIKPIDKEYIYYYFQKIHEEYKKEGVKSALLAFTQHLDDYKSISDKNSEMSNVLFGKYWKIAFENRNAHPNQDCVKTHYVGGRNGIITKRMSTTKLWENYRMYSNLLAEQLKTPHDNLTEAYGKHLAKSYGLTEVSKEKNYFRNKKGTIYLIKSKITKKNNEMEFEISHWNFDFLIIINYELKGKPKYVVEIPIEVAKECNNNHIIKINKNILNDKRNKDISLTFSMVEWL